MRHCWPETWQTLQMYIVAQCIAASNYLQHVQWRSLDVGRIPHTVHKGNAGHKSWLRSSRLIACMGCSLKRKAFLKAHAWTASGAAMAQTTLGRKEAWAHAFAVFPTGFRTLPSPCSRPRGHVTLAWPRDPKVDHESQMLFRV